MKVNINKTTVKKSKNSATFVELITAECALVVYCLYFWHTTVRSARV